MSSRLTKETLDLYKQIQAKPITDRGDFAKAQGWSQSGSQLTGLTSYDLEPLLGHLYPVITPLRDEIPRKTGGIGIQANWKAITAIDTAYGGVGVSEGNRGVAISQTITEYNAAFKGIGQDSFVTFEADWAAEDLFDAKGEAVMSMLNSLKIREEDIMLWGNNSTALGTTPTPTLTDSATGGTLANSTAFNVYCVALTFECYRDFGASVAKGLPLSGIRTLSDGTTETYNAGTAQKSAVATVTTSGSGSNAHSIAATVTAVPNAAAYAWFWGQAGSELLGAVTTINSVSITATATGTQNQSAGFTSDLSRNSLVYDGILTQIFKATTSFSATGVPIVLPTSGSIVQVQATGTAGTGTPLTANAGGYINEIDAILKAYYDNYKIGPDTMWVSSQENQNLRAKGLASSASQGNRFVFDMDSKGMIVGNAVKAYINPFVSVGVDPVIAIKQHPTIPAGTILFTGKRIPYPQQNVPAPLRYLARRDYYQLEYPQIRRKYEYGVYTDGVLQCYFPPLFAAITNIGNG
jgi:hypothetical protein